MDDIFGPISAHQVYTVQDLRRRLGLHDETAFRRLARKIDLRIVKATRKIQLVSGHDFLLAVTGFQEEGGDLDDEDAQKDDDNENRNDRKKGS